VFPPGDGLLLVVLNEPHAPIECAIEVTVAMKSHPGIRLRIGIHSGPVNEVVDVNDRQNVAGAGVDMATIAEVRQAAN
jgi:class 3 adenylate cyclase